MYNIHEKVMRGWKQRNTHIPPKKSGLGCCSMWYWKQNHPKNIAWKFMCHKRHESISFLSPRKSTVRSKTTELQWMITLPKDYTQAVEQFTASNFTFWYCCAPLPVTAAFRACNGYIIITYNSNACWFFVCKHNYQNNLHSLKTNVPQYYTWHHYVFNDSSLLTHSLAPSKSH
jgi:hypothetical protein